MLEIIFALICIFVLLFLFILVIDFMHRKEYFLISQAKEFIRLKIRNEPAEYSSKCALSDVPLAYQEGGQLLIDIICKKLDIPINLFYINEPLVSLLRANINDLEGDFGDLVYDEQYIVPFAYDFLYVLEDYCDSKLWQDRWEHRAIALGHHRG